MKFFKPTPQKGYYPKPKPKPEYVPDSVKYADPSTRELIKPAPLPPPKKDSVETLMKIMKQANGVIQSMLESAKKQNESIKFILKTLKTMSQNHLDLAKRVSVLEGQTLEWTEGRLENFDPPLGEVVFGEGSGELLYEWPLPSPQGRVENPENN